MNEPRWLERQRLIAELENFLSIEDTMGDAVRYHYSFTFARALILLLREQHERDPSVPPDAR